MASTKQYKDFIIEQINQKGNITARSMMGEYLLYQENILFGGIYDDRLLIKITPNGKKLLPNAVQVYPYQGAKPMLLVDELDNTEFLQKLIQKTCEQLPEKKPTKKKK